jgi:hypothetical protein
MHNLNYLLEKKNVKLVNFTLISYIINLFICSTFIYYFIKVLKINNNNRKISMKSIIKKLLIKNLFHNRSLLKIIFHFKLII